MAPGAVRHRPGALLHVAGSITAKPHIWPAAVSELRALTTLACNACEADSRGQLRMCCTCRRVVPHMAWQDEALCTHQGVLSARRGAGAAPALSAEPHPRAVGRGGQAVLHPGLLGPLLQLLLAAVERGGRRVGHHQRLPRHGGRALLDGEVGARAERAPCCN